MTSYGYIIMIIVDSCMIWFHFDCIMQLKKSYHIATNVCSRRSATTFGDLPDCLSSTKAARCEFRILLTHWGRVTYICGQIWVLIDFLFGDKPQPKLMLIYCPNQCWLIANWIPRNKLQWHFNRKLNTFIENFHLQTSSPKWRQFCLGPVLLRRKQRIKLSDVFSRFKYSLHTQAQVKALPWENGPL